MAITNSPVIPTASDQLDAAIANGQTHVISKAAVTSKGAGSFISNWRTAGNPVAGAIPPSGVGAIPNRQTLGAIPLNSWGAATCYFAKVVVAGSVTGTIYIGDRLWHNSGLSGNTTTVQPINGPNITRNLNKPNFLFIEIYSTLGVTVTTATITYTNLQGVANRTATAQIPTSSGAGQLIPVSILDSGVLSIQSVSLNTATGTVGDFGLVIVNQIELIPIGSANIAVRLGIYDMALPQIDTDACLFFYQQCNSGGSVAFNGNMLFGIG
jgi:hypothetical protein